VGANITNWWYRQASIRDNKNGEDSIERILDVLGLYNEENVSKMRSDVSQLEHPQIITSSPSKLKVTDTVVDIQFFSLYSVLGWDKHTL